MQQTIAAAIELYAIKLEQRAERKANEKTLNGN